MLLISNPIYEITLITVFFYICRVKKNSMTPKGVAITVVITMIIVLIALARDFVKNKNQ